jgi:hypothetical protein
MTEDAGVVHGAMGGCTTGSGAKPGGTLRVGARTGSCRCLKPPASEIESCVES